MRHSLTRVRCTLAVRPVATLLARHSNDTEKMQQLTAELAEEIVAHNTRMHMRSIARFSLGTVCVGLVLFGETDFIATGMIFVAAGGFGGLVAAAESSSSCGPHKNIRSKKIISMPPLVIRHAALHANGEDALDALRRFMVDHPDSARMSGATMSTITAQWAATYPTTLDQLAAAPKKLEDN